MNPLLTLREGFSVKPGPGQYCCENCGGIFDKGRSDEEARKEAEAEFGDALESDGEAPAIVCDDCYVEIMKWLGQQQ